MTTLRVPPNDKDAEKAVLGAILLDNEKMDVVLERLTENSFYDSIHGGIFKEMTKLFDKRIPIDIITISDILKDSKILDPRGGIGYLAELLETTPTATNVNYYAKIVEDKKKRRDASTICARVLSDIESTDDVDSLIISAQRDFIKTASTGLSPIVVAGDLFREVIVDLEKAQDGMPTGLETGFIDIDQRTGGFQPTDLVIMAGRPSMGKTALSVQMATQQAKSGKKVVMFSIETDDKQIAKNIFACQSGIDGSKFRNGQLSPTEWDTLYNTVGGLVDIPLIFDDVTRDIQDIIRQARKVKSDTGLDIIYIDHIGLVTTKGTFFSKDDQVGSITRELKALAKELEIRVVALCQLNRGCESRDDKRPMLSDLRDSGNIEQDADTVMFVYRDEYYMKEGRRLTASDEELRDAEIIIAKQRNGLTGTAYLLFFKEYLCFKNKSYIRGHE